MFYMFKGQRFNMIFLNRTHVQIIYFDKNLKHYDRKFFALAPLKLHTYTCMCRLVSLLLACIDIQSHTLYIVHHVIIIY